MANNHNGTELNNVKETWEYNERERANGRSEDTTGANDAASPATPLDQIIREEARAYDTDNKEDRLLGGDWATVNDVDTNG